MGLINLQRLLLILFYSIPFPLLLLLFLIAGTAAIVHVGTDKYRIVWRPGGNTSRLT